MEIGSTIWARDGHHLPLSDQNHECSSHNAQLYIIHKLIINLIDVLSVLKKSVTMYSSHVDHGTIVGSDTETKTCLRALSEYEFVANGRLKLRTVLIDPSLKREWIRMCS